jgi:maltose alpha-D-glucosyltransferase/alpha-amylase
MRAGTELPTDAGGRLRFAATSRLADTPDVEADEVRRLGAEQSNTSIALGQSMILKLFRRLQPGLQPEIEVGRFLTEVAAFPNAPELLGVVEHEDEAGTRTGLAVLQRFVRNQGDAWSFTLDTLRRELDNLVLVPDESAPPLAETFATYMVYAEILGRRTGELHRALATPTDDPAFAAEPLTEDDVAAVAADARRQAERAFAALARIGDRADEATAAAVRALMERREECLALVERLAAPVPGAAKIRVHGDFHLGQVLIVQDDVMIVDFEGEPSRSTQERRAKGSPLRDVAGILRSFAYAAETAAREVGGRFGESEAGRAAAAAEGWRTLAEDVFLSAYEEAAAAAPGWVEDEDARAGLLRLHLLAKALYEINYEADHRPDWIRTPVHGVLSILDEESA